MQAQLARVLQEVQWLGLRLDPNTEVQAPAACCAHMARSNLPGITWQRSTWYHTDKQCCIFVCDPICLFQLQVFGGSLCNVA